MAESNCSGIAAAERVDFEEAYRKHASRLIKLCLVGIAITFYAVDVSSVFSVRVANLDALGARRIIVVAVALATVPYMIERRDQLSILQGSIRSGPEKIARYEGLLGEVIGSAHSEELDPVDADGESLGSKWPDKLEQMLASQSKGLALASSELGSSELKGKFDENLRRLCTSVYRDFDRRRLRESKELKCRLEAALGKLDQERETFRVAVQATSLRLKYELRAPLIVLVAYFLCSLLLKYLGVNSLLEHNL